MAKTLKMFDGDIYINNIGRSILIEDVEKLSQDLAEVLLTQYDANRDYGNELITLDIPVAITNLTGEALISRKVDEAIQKLKAKQKKDTSLSPQEAIKSVKNIVVQQLNNIGSYVFLVTVETEKKQTVTRAIAASLRHQNSAFTSIANELLAKLRG